MSIFKKVGNKLKHHETGTAEELRKHGAVIGNNFRNLSGPDVFSTEPFLVEVGDNVTFSTNVKLYPHDGSIGVIRNLYPEFKNADRMGFIKLGNNIVVGHGAMILSGVTLGDNIIVGAGAIVTKSFPSNVVIAGVPAKIICSVEDYFNKHKDEFIDVKTATKGKCEEEKIRIIREMVLKANKIDD